MTSTIVILFLAAFLGGLSYWIIPKSNQKLDFLLTFAGSYLFAITILHILPELFSEHHHHQNTALFVLLGFFLQQILEYFSAGIEHGHFHQKNGVSNVKKISILIALSIHSLLEGTLLHHGAHEHHSHESHSLLLGIILHKAPAAFALMITLGNMGKKSILLLALFSLASPLGLVISENLALSTTNMNLLFALVGGSFLHISTTIFVESSPNHHFQWNRIAVAISGALLAIIAEYFI